MTVMSVSELVVPAELMLDAVDVELLAVVTMELPELDIPGLCLCFTELLGLIVLRPRNLIA